MDSIGFYRPTMLRQNLLVPDPTFTEANLPDQAGKIFIVTGANTGVGRELARILYAAHAIVYCACRSEAKARTAMDEIKAAASSSGGSGRLEFLALDLGDLRSVRAAADAFLARESRLHVLFNNAGVMLPADDSAKTAQGYDLQLGTNCLGPFLLTQLLTPVLARTAAEESTGAGVRVVWVSSMAAELYSPSNGGVDMANLRGERDYVRVPPLMERYGISKAGTYLYSVEFARRQQLESASAGKIISVAVNPGNLDSDLYRAVGDQKGFFNRTGLRFFATTMLYPVVNGACTELFAGLSPEVTLQKSGSWIGPFGRFFDIRKDIAVNAKPLSEGRKGNAERFWLWSVEQVKEYL